MGVRPVELGKPTLALDVATQNGSLALRAERLILALPRLPLLKLTRHLPEHIAAQLDSVNGFPMLKVFFVCNTPWWSYGQPPQQYANCMPTREIHYFRRPPEADPDGHGMVLLYMDRPSTSSGATTSSTATATTAPSWTRTHASSTPSPSSSRAT
jgi:hypothetical protein